MPQQSLKIIRITFKHLNEALKKKEREEGILQLSQKNKKRN
jgi:hypothetical protein